MSKINLKIKFSKEFKNHYIMLGVYDEESYSKKELFAEHAQYKKLYPNDFNEGICFNFLVTEGIWAIKCLISENPNKQPDIPKAWGTSGKRGMFGPEKWQNVNFEIGPNQEENIEILVK